MKANWYNNKKLRKGFTLVELIIVMVIIENIMNLIFLLL